MKLSYIRLADKGMQTQHGRLGETLAAPTFDLVYVGNMRCVRVSREEWQGSYVYIPIERLDNLTPDPEALVPKKT